MCMACEEMELYYAYLDAVEEAKRKAQPWQCEVTVIPQGDERRRLPASARAAEAGIAVRLRRAGMTELTALTIADARDGLKQKKFSAAELADAHLAAMEQARALNAYVLETPERARAMAKASRRAHRQGRGAVRSKAFRSAIKDLFCTEGVRTTACSHILDNFVPTYESTVTAHLWRDGAVHARQDSTTTNSPWARRTRPRASAR